MNFYIVDDDLSVIEMLREIIENEKMGRIVGYNISSLNSEREIIAYDPDVVLVDMLMPDIDGIELVRRLKDEGVTSRFIMISQVSSKKIIEEAYEAGIEFYIGKPINKKEVTNVISNVTGKLQLEKNFSMMRGMFSDLEKSKQQLNNKNGFHSEELNSYNEKDVYLSSIKKVFSQLGILGEKGCDDMIELYSYLYDEEIKVSDVKVKEVANKISDNSTAMEQRIRRAINKGLRNVANIGIEDYLNETFVLFSNSIYDFQNVKAEMDYIRKKRLKGGKINIKRFIDNVIVIALE